MHKPVNLSSLQNAADILNVYVLLDWSFGPLFKTFHAAMHTKFTTLQAEEN